MGSFWFSLLLVLHILLGCSVIGFVLLQHGKGADMGAAFGSGASGSLFGSSGSANFLSRTTGILAAFFFVSSLTLSYFASKSHVQGPSDLMEGVAAPVVPVVVPASAPGQDIPK
ncbi:preprotein translocase subunit SecG [Uliginosibacterium flavum]|uniref:Protein-export membrane protein SecG n=1 Tax=Uliginosibacterium flavum TaxID=1396831 RepID=A0ABV2TFJ0_9RHOO